MRRPTGEDGNAMLEFTYLSLLLMVPLFYGMLAVFAVQSAAFAVTEAARQGARAYVTSSSDAEGRERARVAATYSFTDQGIDDAPQLRFCDGTCSLAPGSRVEVTVQRDVPLPLLSAFLPDGRGVIPVSGRAVQVVDRFRESP